MTDEAPAGAGTEPEAPAPGPERSRELALAPHRVSHEVIRPLDPAQVVASMRTHQELLRQILDPTDWQGPPDKAGSFVKKSGWRKIALSYNLSLGHVSEEVERDDEGTPLRATYTAWAEAPNGRRVEATGHCAQSESRFAKEKGRQKLENDMRATAETRAKNRAISDLIGMGKVSAEEVDAGTAGGVPMADEELQQRMVRALAFLLDTGDGPNTALAGRAYNAIGTQFNGIPEAAAWGALRTAAVLKAHLDSLEPAAPPDAPAAPPPDDAEVVSGEPVPDDAAAAEAAAIANDVFGGTNP